MTAVELPIDAEGHGPARFSFAFLWMGWLTAISYPASFLMEQINNMMPVVIYYFVAHLVGSNRASVLGDYYTFVIIGLAAMRLLSGALRGVGEELERAVEQGRLEALLVQPINWRMLPFGLAQWPIAWRFVNVAILIGLSVPLGANYNLAGVPLALLVVVLGSAATMAVGIIAASVKVLAKRTDPVLTLYALAASVLSGVFFPIDLLPGGVRVVSYLIPDTYVIAALRELLMAGGGGLVGPSALQAVFGLLAFDIVAFPCALWLFGRSLEYARTAGVLGGY